jgi:alpha-1,2-mannosyltransferase
MTAAFIDTIRSGRWLTRERIRLWAFAALAASAAGLVFVIATSDGLNDYQNRPLGTDFSNVYAAGTYVLDDNAAAAFDWPAQHARERAIFGDNTPFYGWHYPPFFLFVAGVLALMPYALSLAVWQGVTLVLYLVSLRTILSASWPGLSRPSTPYFEDAPKQVVDARDKRGHDGGGILARDPLWLLLALAFPAVFVNIGHGHNGFLTAALLGAALATLDRRPTMAGVLFGLIAYKPQFGVLIPLVLIATGRWRTFLAAAATVVALGIATLIAFGPDVWKAFFASTRLTRVEVLEQGGAGWHKIQSAFSMVRMWSGGVPLAYAMQGTVSAVLALALVWLWRSAASYPIKAAALGIAAILATPYSLDYDFVVLAPAIAFLAADGFSRGFAPYEKTVLALLWFMPLIARTVAEWTLIPLGVPAMLIVLMLAMRRAAHEAGSLAPRQSAARPIK